MLEAFIKEFRESSPFEELYRNGFEAKDLKRLIINTLDPYFQDKDSLEKYSTETLIAGWINFVKFKEDEWALENFKYCLELFNESKKQSNDVYTIILSWMPSINDSLTKFWSFKKLASDLDELAPEEHLEESLKIIGQVLEGIIKNYLKLLVHLNRELRGKETSKEIIDNLKLGSLVNELKTTSKFPELLSPPPWGLALNQWRNIAYHHNAKIIEETIICSYGEAPNIKEIHLTRNELTTLVKRICSIYNAFKNSEFIFVFDNLAEYQNHFKSTSTADFTLRKEVLLIELFSGINSQGFIIIDYNHTENNASLVLQDLTAKDSTRRSIHSSQFLYQLWMYSGADNVSIEYRLNNGQPFLLSNTNKEVCEKISNNTENISYLAEKVEFRRLQNV